jgi:hypothetical protein
LYVGVYSIEEVHHTLCNLAEVPKIYASQIFTQRRLPLFCRGIPEGERSFVEVGELDNVRLYSLDFVGQTVLHSLEQLAARSPQLVDLVVSEIFDIRIIEQLGASLQDAFEPQLDGLPVQKDDRVDKRVPVECSLE